MHTLRQKVGVDTYFKSQSGNIYFKNPNNIFTRNSGNIVFPNFGEEMSGETDWTSDLCNCCDDTKSCCYGFWCCPCLACTVAGNFNQNRCLPLSLRVGVRYKYNIKGSLCKDIATSCICVWCSWCQLHRELKYRKVGPAVVNMQPTK
uniref:Cornifelin-like n=1 Tax=Fundulus heteroclitus TaxID=8078 RepID=A0A3Q2R4M2_FUNHE